MYDFGDQAWSRTGNLEATYFHSAEYKIQHDIWNAIEAINNVKYDTNTITLMKSPIIYRLIHSRHGFRAVKSVMHFIWLILLLSRY